MPQTSAVAAGKRDRIITCVLRQGGRACPLVLLSAR
jgi:hypothetical protein